MTIGFYNVTPAPLAGVIDFNSDIWQKECVFEPGMKYRIAAPSGKGKSTFIHYIYGLRDDYSGVVRVNQQDVKTFSRDQWSALRQQQVSIVYQDLRLFLHLTARENILVKSVLYKGGSEARIDKMAEALNIANVIHKKCSTLSYGERQRVGIIRSLIQPFAWLLLDEPFSHLDIENTIRAVALINEEVQHRKAGLIVTSLDEDHHFDYDKKLQL